MSNATTQGPAVHEWTGPTGVKFRDVREPSGTYYHDTTPRAVVQALEAAMQSGAKVRLFLGEAKTGQDWLSEWDVYGTVGRSMGPIKIPLLIKTARSHGGGAILADCIVRLIVDGREVYRHPGYKVPSIVIYHEGKHPRVPWAAKVNGSREVHARFETSAQASRWARFIQGERLCK
jgi:hypothetical protein